MRTPFLVAACIAAAALSGCATITDDQKRDAINAVNAEFKRQYEQILAEQGARFYRVSPDEAFDTLRVTLTRMGMRIGDQSPSIGYLNVFAPAPTPLDQDEWLKAEAQDLPKMREIVCKYIDLRCQFIRFEPEGLDIVINGTVNPVRSGAEVSLTVRMREVKPPKTGMPRRDYAPPTAVRMGLDKIWRNYEQELRAVRGL
jgi:hypothetical protein